MPVAWITIVAMGTGGGEGHHKALGVYGPGAHHQFPVDYMSGAVGEQNGMLLTFAGLLLIGALRVWCLLPARR